jgi:hypothetical protein
MHPDIVCAVRILKVFVIAVLVVGGLGFGLCVLLWGYLNGATLTTCKLSEGHTLRIVQDREFDIADSVLCQLDGPTVRHGRRYVAATGAGTSVPRFNLTLGYECTSALDHHRDNAVVNTLYRRFRESNFLAGM